MDEQKLIYSGQLLNDSHILKDVLRQYEGQEAHTVHLVYTPKKGQQQSYATKPSQPKRNDSNQQSRQQSSQQPQTGNSTSTDGLR